MYAHRVTTRLLFASALLVACSAPPPLRTNDVPSADTSSTAPAVDLSPVPAPAGVVAKGRAKNLGATTRVVAALVGAPPEGLEGAGRAVVAQILGRGLRLEIDPAFAEHVALDAPVDFVVAADESADVRMAFSVGLTSLEGAKAAAGPNVAEVGPGVWALGGERAKAACAIMNAAGAAPARLVCGPRQQDVTALGPYLVRTVSVEPLPAQDILANIDVAAINEAFGPTARKLIPGLPLIAAKQWGTGNATYDKALEEGARFLASDLGLVLEDVKNIRIEGKVDGATGVGVKVRAELAPGAKSWLARTALASAANRVPELLWDAPSDATGAVFGTITDLSAYGDITKALTGMVSGSLEMAKVGSDAERKKIASLLDLPLARKASVVGLGGFGRLTKANEPKTARERQQRHFDRLMGWYMIGTNQKADAWAKWLKDAASAFNQPGVQKALKKELGKDESVAVASVKPPKELGKGASQLDITFSSKLEENSVAQGTLHLMLMPDGEASWFALGFDRAELVERLMRAKDGKDSLKTRADVAPLGQGPATAGAFLTLQSFRSSVYAMMLMRPAKSEETKGDKDVDLAAKALRATDEVFASLPHKGLSPMFIKTTVQDNALGFEIELKKPVLDDASTLVKMFSVKR